MESWLDSKLAAVRLQLTSADEGSVWVLLFHDPDDAPVVTFAVQGAMAQMDRQMTRNLAYILDEVPADAALLAIPRQDGIPHRADRQLWRELQVRMADASTQLLDLIVVGDRRHWSAQRDTGAEQPLRRRTS